LKTGRKHQIRVHLSGLGCLVAGDRRYGSKVDPCGRLALHACELAFTHPLSGEVLRFTSPLPPALRKLFPLGQRPIARHNATGKSDR
jgi:23S rRNA pseudouridine1911/1915/1917 synthase